MLKEIAMGIEVIILTLGSYAGISKNCKQQIDKYFPRVEQNFIDAKREFQKGNYDAVKQIADNTRQAIVSLNARGGELFYLFFAKGIEVHKMYRDIMDLERTLLF